PAHGRPGCQPRWRAPAPRRPAPHRWPGLRAGPNRSPRGRPLNNPSAGRSKLGGAPGPPGPRARRHPLRGRRMRLIATLTLLLLAASPWAGEPELTPYHAVYEARYNGMPIEAHRQLQHTDKGYRIVTEARNFLGHIREEEHFQRDAKGRLIPENYVYDRKILGKSRKETIAVD